MRSPPFIRSHSFTVSRESVKKPKSNKLHFKLNSLVGRFYITFCIHRCHRIVIHCLANGSIKFMNLLDAFKALFQVFWFMSPGLISKRCRPNEWREKSIALKATFFQQLHSISFRVYSLCWLRVTYLATQQCWLDALLVGIKIVVYLVKWCLQWRALSVRTIFKSFEYTLHTHIQIHTQTILHFYLYLAQFCHQIGKERCTKA